MITTEQIIEWILMITPSVLAVVTVLVSIIKTLKEFSAVKKDVADLKCIDELKDKIDTVIDENYELKKTLNETLTKLDHVQRGKDHGRKSD